MTNEKIDLDCLEFYETTKFSIRYASGRWTNGHRDPRGRSYHSICWSSLDEVKEHLKKVGKQSYKDAHVIVWAKDNTTSPSSRPYNNNIALEIPIVPGVQR